MGLYQPLGPAGTRQQQHVAKLRRVPAVSSLRLAPASRVGTCVRTALGPLVPQLRPSQSTGWVAYSNLAST